MAVWSIETSTPESRKPKSKGICSPEGPKHTSSARRRPSYPGAGASYMSRRLQAIGAKVVPWRGTPSKTRQTGRDKKSKGGCSRQRRQRQENLCPDVPTRHTLEGHCNRTGQGNVGTVTADRGGATASTRSVLPKRNEAANPFNE